MTDELDDFAEEIAADRRFDRGCRIVAGLILLAIVAGAVVLACWVCS